MKPLLRNSILVGVILLLIGGSCVLYADRLLDAVVRPWIEQQAGQALHGKVHIGKLFLQSDRFAGDALTFETDKGLSLSIARIEAEFSFASLLQNRLQAVRIDSPVLKLDIPQQDDASPPSQTHLSRPSWRIEHLALNHGKVLVSSGEWQALLHDIDIQTTLDEVAPFEIAAFVGVGQEYPLAVRGKMRWNEALAVSLHEVLWQERPLLDAPLELSLLAEGEARGGGALQFASLDDKQLVQLLAAVGIPSPLPQEFGFDLEAPVVSFSLGKESLNAGISVEHAQLHLGDKRVPLEKILIEMSGQGAQWQATGSLLGPVAMALNFNAGYDAEQLTGKATVEVPDPDWLIQELLGLKPIKITGGLQIDSNFSRRQGDLQVQGQFQSLGYQVQSRVGGEGQKSSAKGFRFNLVPLSGDFSWQQSEQQKPFDLHLRLGKTPILTASGGLENIKFSLAIQNRQQLESVLGPGLLPAAVDAIDEVTMSGQLHQETDGGWGGAVQLSAHKIGIAGIVANDLLVKGEMALAADKLSFSQATITAMLVDGKTFKGGLAGRFAAGLNDQNYFIKLEEFILDKVEYFSADGVYGLGGGGVELHGQFSGELDNAGLKLELEGVGKAAEVLAGAFYADLSALRGHFKLVGELTPVDSLLTAKVLSIDVAGLGTFSGGGRLAPAEISLAGRLQLDDLAKSYGRHLGPVLVEWSPSLMGLSLAGSLAIDYDLHWTPSAAQLTGEIVPSGLAVNWPQKHLEIVEGNGRLPFVLVRGESPADAANDSERFGELSFAGFSVGTAHLEGGRLQLKAIPNHFTVRSPLVFSIAKGQVAINDLSFGLGPEGPLGSLRIAAHDIDLETLTRELSLPVMSGRINAELGEIRYADQQVSSEGDAEIDVFSGRFQIRNMRYLKPFSPYPVFTADVDFSGLDLHQATRTFDFGEMNGVVDGYVHGLRLFGVTPSAFEALLESRTEGTRNISVKALNNLSVLSQGGLASALSKGVYRFIDFYRYKKIGIYCALNNDTFILKGTAVDDSEKYLVYGGMLPPRIDIITSAPKISFKEMVHRISRIKRAKD